jgi:hypothetical protein
MWNINIALAFYIFTINENTSKIKKYKVWNNKENFNTWTLNPKHYNKP